MSFLATCRCEGDACTCNDFITGEPIAKTKGSISMSYGQDEVLQKIHTAMSGNPKVKLSGAQKFTKLSDLLLSCSNPDREKLLDDIVQAAPNLPLATLKRLSGELSAAAKAKEAQRSRKAIRLGRLEAAMTNQADDPHTADRVELARGELRRLGLNINESGPDGFNVFEVDQKMKAANWSDERRGALKACMYEIGLIEG
jgi:hypothetical protein